MAADPRKARSREMDTCTGATCAGSAAAARASAAWEEGAGTWIRLCLSASSSACSCSAMGCVCIRWKCNRRLQQPGGANLNAAGAPSRSTTRTYLDSNQIAHCVRSTVTAKLPKLARATGAASTLGRYHPEPPQSGLSSSPLPVSGSGRHDRRQHGDTARPRRSPPGSTQWRSVPGGKPETGDLPARPA